MKFFVVLMMIMIAFVFSWAGQAFAVEKAPAHIKVVASFYPMYIMARNVAEGVPGVTVENLTPPVTGCLHDYAITTSDMRKLADADVLVVNGAGMESFLEQVITQYPAVKVVRLSDGIPLLQGAEGDNPHVWVSVSYAIRQVEHLGAAMQAADPAHAPMYQKNTEAYVMRLKALQQKMHAELEPYKGKEIITFHEAFPYFAEEFGLNIIAVVEREPGSAPSAKELAETVDLIKKVGIKTLFSEPQYSGVAAQTIARETGAVIYTLDPAVTGDDTLDAYIRIMEQNLEVLKDAFSR
jgi:zinc transport system substrate-binding protein